MEVTGTIIPLEVFMCATIVCICICAETGFGICAIHQMLVSSSYIEYSIATMNRVKHDSTIWCWSQIDFADRQRARNSTKRLLIWG